MPDPHLTPSALEVENARLRDELAQQKLRTQVLIELPSFAYSLPESEFMQYGLEQAERLTESEISFIHFVNDDEETIELVTWSRRTLESYCHAAFERHYPVSQAGLWAEALRKHHPTIVNDYESAQDKRGMPEGHAALQRMVVVPVMELDKVVMLVGIGNRASDYGQTHVDALELVANAIWRLVQRLRNIAQLARFNHLLERSRTEIFSFDTDTLNFVDVSPGACRNLGYSLEELRRITPLDIKPELTREAFLVLLEPLKAGQVPLVKLNTLHRRKNGSTYPVELQIELDQSVNAVFIATGWDVSERHRLENNIRQLAQAIEQSPEGIIFTDTKADIQYVNAAFLSATGYQLDEVLGRNPRILQSGKTPQASYEAMWATLRQGVAWEGELVNRRKNGSEYTEWARISPVRQSDGRITHYLGINQDITERLRYEQHLTEMLGEQRALNKKLEEATHQLLQSEKMASIGQLAAGVAHELNNPIGFVSSNLGTLESYLRDLFAIADAYADVEQAVGADCPQLEHVRSVKQTKDYDYLRGDIFQLMAESKDGLERVAKIVKNLKDFSRAGDSQMHWADLHQGLESTINIVWNELKYKCEVKKDYGSLPQVWCELSQLNQVFLNLLVNAGHAIAEKGIITIRTGQKGDEVFVAISDTGCGISPEHIKRVFEPFFTTKPVGKGTGLGLSLSYSIVQKHKGRIEIQSEVGKGSTLTVWLPIEPMSDKTVTSVEAVPPAPTS